MAVGEPNFEFYPVPGVRLAATACGIKHDVTDAIQGEMSHALDLALIEFVAGSTTAGVFTQNLFAASPVVLGKQHLLAMPPKYFLINTGSANAGVGDIGFADAMACCQALAQLTGSKLEAVIPFSTGVIGERLPVGSITSALNELLEGLSAHNWLVAAKAMMTTDTRPKVASRQFVIGAEQVTITGIAKGSGMIQPNMATMLSYISTDIKASRKTLQKLLVSAVNSSFNRITVDSDTSTNDACMLTATGLSGIDIDTNATAFQHFKSELIRLCIALAQGIIKDAEGATKFIEVQVKGGQSEQECLTIGYSIANSPLLKTAMFASDANWGRIVMAIGKADVDIDVQQLDVYLGDVQLIHKGQKAPAYTEATGNEIMARDEISIRVDMHRGNCEQTVWTSDLSYDYVRINASYRT